MVGTVKNLIKLLWHSLCSKRTIKKSNYCKCNLSLAGFEHYTNSIIFVKRRHFTMFVAKITALPLEMAVLLTN